MIETYRGYVYPWHCDEMGHMNTQFYAAAYDSAQMTLLSQLSHSAKDMAPHMGWADVKQIIEYKSELRSNTAICIESDIVRLGTKSFTTAHTLKCLAGSVCGTCETTTVSFNLETRKATQLSVGIRLVLERLQSPENNTES